MQFDQTLMFQDDTAVANASTEVDTSSATDGSMICVGVTSKSGAGTATVTVTSSATAGGTYSTDVALTIPTATTNDGAFFCLPSYVKRYVKVDVTAATAGTFTAGVLCGTQTNL